MAETTTSPQRLRPVQDDLSLPPLSRDGDSFHVVATVPCGLESASAWDTLLPAGR